MAMCFGALWLVDNLLKCFLLENMHHVIFIMWYKSKLSCAKDIFLLTCLSCIVPVNSPWHECLHHSGTFLHEDARPCGRAHAVITLTLADGASAEQGLFCALRGPRGCKLHLKRLAVKTLQCSQSQVFLFKKTVPTITILFSKSWKEHRWQETEAQKS